MDAVMQFIWLRVPLLAARLWPGAGIALGDGHYLVRWPAAALIVGPACGFAGLLAGALHGGRTFTYSLAAMVLFAVIGQAGAAIGLWATVGYAIGDLLLHEDNTWYWLTGVAWFFQGLLPALLSYVLLGLLTVVLPMTVLGVRAMVSGVRWMPRAVLPWAELAAVVLAAAFGAYVWTRTVPMLIRPVFTWPGGVPSVADIQPLQETGWVVVLLAALAAAGRVFLDRVALIGKVATFSQILWAGLGAQLARGPRRGVAGLVMVGVGAVSVTWLLSGMIGNYLEAVIVLAFFAGLLFLRRLLLLQAAPAVALLNRVPYLVRFGAGLVLGYLVAQVVIGFFWSRTTSFLPVLASACVAIALMTLLTLPPPPATAPAGPPKKARLT